MWKIKTEDKQNVEHKKKVKKTNKKHSHAAVKLLALVTKSLKNKNKKINNNKKTFKGPVRGIYF